MLVESKISKISIFPFLLHRVCFSVLQYIENQGNEYQTTEKEGKGSDCFCNHFHEDREEMKIPNINW